jgi:hypothetical protein
MIRVIPPFVLSLLLLGIGSCVADFSNWLRPEQQPPATAGNDLDCQADLTSASGSSAREAACDAPASAPLRTSRSTSESGECSAGVLTAAQRHELPIASAIPPLAETDPCGPSLVTQHVRLQT